jgi:hypothetical protein
MTTAGPEAGAGALAACLFLFDRNDIKKSRILRLLLRTQSRILTTGMDLALALRTALRATRRRPYRPTWWITQAPVNGRSRCVRTGFGRVRCRRIRRNLPPRTRTRGGRFGLCRQLRRVRVPGPPPGPGTGPPDRLRRWPAGLPGLPVPAGVLLQRAGRNRGGTIFRRPRTNGDRGRETPPARVPGNPIPPRGRAVRCPPVRGKPPLETVLPERDPGRARALAPGRAPARAPGREDREGRDIPAARFQAEPRRELPGRTPPVRPVPEREDPRPLRADLPDRPGILLRTAARGARTGLLRPVRRGPPRIGPPRGERIPRTPGRPRIPPPPRGIRIRPPPGNPILRGIRGMRPARRPGGSPRKPGGSPLEWRLRIFRTATTRTTTPRTKRAMMTVLCQPITWPRPPSRTRSTQRPIPARLA